MAGGLAVVANDGEDYHGKLTCFVILACMMAAMGGVIFGYDIGISGLIFLYFLCYTKQQGILFLIAFIFFVMYNQLICFISLTQVLKNVKVE